MNLKEIKRIFDKIAELYNNFKILTETKEEYKLLEIKNPYWEENIKIIFDTEITVCFSYQHVHVSMMAGRTEKCELDLLIEYINDIINNKKVAVGFFIEDKLVLGGEKYHDEIDISSGESILRSFINEDDLYFNYFRGHNLRCAIRGWDINLNKDINFNI